MVEPVEISRRKIGPQQPCFIIAEAGVNHNGSVEMALRLVEAAVRAGVDAVKFQTFRAEQVISRHAPKAPYQVRTDQSHESQLEMVKRLELPCEAFRVIQEACEKRTILFLSTPFDEESIDVLVGLGVPAIKIASGELTNLPLLERVARTGKPVILSTGMSTLGEVQEAVQVLKRAGNKQLILLHCVSSYPADPRDANLRAMGTLAETFGVPVGYSDHTSGIEVAIAAVALGACVIEKHFTLDRTLPGPDHQASLEPSELAALVRGIRMVEAAFGHGRKEPAASEAGIAAVARKSLVSSRGIPAGTRLTESLIAIKRPGTGFPPALRPQLVGKTAKVDIPADTILTWELLG